LNVLTAVSIQIEVVRDVTPQNGRSLPVFPRNVLPLFSMQKRKEVSVRHWYLCIRMHDVKYQNIIICRKLYPQIVFNYSVGGETNTLEDQLNEILLGMIGPLDLFHEFVDNDTNTTAAATTITANSMTITTTTTISYYLLRFTVALNSALLFSELLVCEFLLGKSESLLY
jgi:hypothetical protein